MMPVLGVKSDWRNCARMLSRAFSEIRAELVYTVRQSIDQNMLSHHERPVNSHFGSMTNRSSEK
jgi:hypothetical protein